MKKVVKTTNTAKITKVVKIGTEANFWGKLPKPFFALAPMANVTDSVFRKMIVKYGKPDVMWTEFVSADGLISAGQKKLLVDLVYSEKERPVVAQLFAKNPVSMGKAATIIVELSFDGLDINMGCPDRAVEKQGGGAAMMKNPKAALAVLEAARAGTVSRLCRQKPYSAIPVSVKTRIGYSKIDLEWIRLLLEQKLPALTVHLRTRKEMSDVPAHWEVMPEIVKMRDEICPETLIIGNGDVVSRQDGLEKAKKYGCDGVMVGRGIFGKPWFFEKGESAGGRDAEKNGTEKHGIEKPPEQRLKIMLEHARSFDKTFCGEKHVKNFAVMKKHFKAYVSGWDGAKELRAKLMQTDCYVEVEKIVEDYLLKHLAK